MIFSEADRVKNQIETKHTIHGKPTKRYTFKRNMHLKKMINVEIAYIHLCIKIRFKEYEPDIFS